jgi:hypothetical protein
VRTSHKKHVKVGGQSEYTRGKIRLGVSLNLNGLKRREKKIEEKEKKEKWYFCVADIRAISEVVFFAPLGISSILSGLLFQCGNFCFSDIEISLSLVRKEGIKTR